MMCCDIVVNNEHKTMLQKRYCELHNLDVFPAPFTPNLLPPAAPPIDQDGLMHIRGGGGEDDDELNLQDVLGFSEEEGSPRTNVGVPG